MFPAGERVVRDCPLRGLTHCPGNSRTVITYTACNLTVGTNRKYRFSDPFPAKGQRERTPRQDNGHNSENSRAHHQYIYVVQRLPRTCTYTHGRQVINMWRRLVTLYNVYRCAITCIKYTTECTILHAGLGTRRIILNPIYFKINIL